MQACVKTSKFIVYCQARANMPDRIKIELKTHRSSSHSIDSVQTEIKSISYTEKEVSFDDYPDVFTYTVLYAVSAKDVAVYVLPLVSNDRVITANKVPYSFGPFMKIPMPKLIDIVPLNAKDLDGWEPSQSNRCFVLLRGGKLGMVELGSIFEESFIFPQFNFDYKEFEKEDAKRCFKKVPVRNVHLLQAFGDEIYCINSGEGGFDIINLQTAKTEFSFQHKDALPVTLKKEQGLWFVGLNNAEIIVLNEEFELINSFNECVEPNGNFRFAIENHSSKELVHIVIHNDEHIYHVMFNANDGTFRIVDDVFVMPSFIVTGVLILSDELFVYQNRHTLVNRRSMGVQFPDGYECKTPKPEPIIVAEPEKIPEEPKEAVEIDLQKDDEDEDEDTAAATHERQMSNLLETIASVSTPRTSISKKSRTPSVELEEEPHFDMSAVTALIEAAVDPLQERLVTLEEQNDTLASQLADKEREFKGVFDKIHGRQEKLSSAVKTYSKSIKEVIERTSHSFREHTRVLEQLTTDQQKSHKKINKNLTSINQLKKKPKVSDQQVVVRELQKSFNGLRKSLQKLKQDFDNKLEDISTGGGVPVAAGENQTLALMHLHMLLEASTFDTFDFEANKPADVLQNLSTMLTSAMSFVRIEVVLPWINYILIEYTVDNSTFDYFLELANNLLEQMVRETPENCVFIAPIIKTCVNAIRSQ
ncbi:hypothetical protein PCE1_000564 [Barthelona sp. PCE]